MLSSSPIHPVFAQLATAAHVGRFIRRHGCGGCIGESAGSAGPAECAAPDQGDPGTGGVCGAHWLPFVR